MSRLDNCESRSRDEFVTHFRTKYTSERFLPIWMSVEVWELGLLSHFWGGMRHRDITAISQKYGLTDARLLPSWTRTFTFVRNVCAHHGRLWNRPMVDQPAFPGAGVLAEFNHVVANRPASGTSLRHTGDSQFPRPSAECGDRVASSCQRVAGQLPGFPFAQSNVSRVSCRLETTTHLELAERIYLLAKSTNATEI
jgi:hypothetical protein